jgi:hypothetical protein
MNSSALEDIRDEIIQEGFPELMDEDVQIAYENIDDALCAYGELTEEGYYIDVDISLRDAPRRVIEGGVAHELSHILTDRDAGTEDTEAYRLSKRYRILDERNTDVLTILRGYGPQLLAFLEYSEKKEFPRYKEDGLSMREIRKILSFLSTHPDKRFK